MTAEVFEKHADLLQSFIVVMQDLVDEEQTDCVAPSSSTAQAQAQLQSQSSFYPYNNAETVYDVVSGVTMLHLNGEETNSHEEAATTQQRAPDSRPSLIEFSKAVSMESRMREVGDILRREVMSNAPHLVADRVLHGKVFPNCMVGSEMVDWLLDVSIRLSASGATLSRFQVGGMWQALLEYDVIHHVRSEQQFADKQLYYRWTTHKDNSSFHTPRAKGAEVEEELASALFLLATVGPDALFRMILAKPSSERTPEELELVYEELIHVKALSHLSTMVKRELAIVIGFESHTHPGTVIFRQGDPGTSWYIILKGSVDVSIHAKGVVCTLREGDDFGKLALLNDSPRAATITLRESNAQFLRVDKHHFNRILRDVEANTVRLKEHGEDVLVLEKMSLPRGAAIERKTASHCSYSVMAGLAEKMLEYLIETRIDAQEEDVRVLDATLQDFLLTHSIYMPTNILCNNLKLYYMREPTTAIKLEKEMDVEHLLTAKRRIVTFVALWVRTLGIHFFLDPSANSFVEELFCCVMEDSSVLPRMSSILTRIRGVREARERAMQLLSRHPLLVLDLSVYRPTAPAPQPILPIDICNQIVRLPDSSSFVVPVRVEKRCEEIIELCRPHVRLANANDHFILVEIKSDGERAVINNKEVSVPTLLSLNGKLFICTKDELDSLVVHGDDFGPSDSSSILEYVASSELSQQFAVFHMMLFEATSEIELLSQVFGRGEFPGNIPSNLDLLMRRFNEVQFWSTTEVLQSLPSKRVHTLRKLIKIAAYSKNNGDLLGMFAITLGLSNIAVSRLTSIWEKLPSKMRRSFAELESLLDPTRNHRAYRSLVAKMQPPFVPFVPLLLKDLTFIHEGNKTYFNGLVNFEKMRMIANVMRSFKESKESYEGVQSKEERKTLEENCLIRNLRVIDSQRRLMDLSYEIEPRRRRN